MGTLPLDRLAEGTASERAAAARRVREAAGERPARLRGSLDALVAATDDDHTPVREAVVAAIADLAADDPAAAAPVTESLVAAVEDDSAEVRAAAARAVAVLADARPRRVRFAVGTLAGALTDAEPVRADTARALAALTPRYPEVVHAHLDALVRALFDEYAPVQAAVLRTLAPIERTYPDALDVVDTRLRDLVTADAPGVRQAACRAVAANRPTWARKALRERCREEPHPVVRETARAALAAVDAAEAPPATPEGSASDVLESVTLGSWVAVRTDEDAAPAVGRVSAITHEPSETDVESRRGRGLCRADFDSREAWLSAPRVEPSGDRRVVHLHDPFGGGGLNLVPVSGGVGAEFTGPDRSVPSLHRPATVQAVAPDRARLLAAGPGDELAFELDGADHTIEVTTAGERGGVYRVAGRNRERGYEITFRPLGPNPRMAVFAEGRAFRAEDIQLR